MPTTNTPVGDPALAPRPTPRPDGGDLYEASHWESAYREFDADDVPHLLVQLQDDLARSRRREAIWLSVIFHLAVVILIVNEPRLERLLPHRTVLVASNRMDQKELTYLELPPDEQKLTKRPDANAISDKDRIATSRSPHVDPKELKKILDSARPGRPGEGGPALPPQPNQSPAQAQNAAPPSQEQASAPPAPANSNQIAKLQAPPIGKPQPQINFGSSMSAGSAIEQAARAALANRGAGYGGDGGDYGLGQGRQGQVLGNMEVLSDTMGVDFGPYLARILHDVRQNWYNLIPEVARPPLMKKGKLAIEFAILKDGSVTGMQRVVTSGDIALDRAAWGGITASSPFPPLPKEFGGQYLALRFYFFYNPDKSDLQ
jgi:outer membrane biosynthesis protein TonB